MTKNFDLVQCISDHEVVFANNYYFPHPSSLSFFIRLSWTVQLAISDRSAVASHDCGSLPRESSPSEATPDVPVGLGHSKIEITSGLSFSRQDIPIVGTIAYAGWKESSLKCLSHKKLCSNDREFSLLAESTAPYGGHRSGIKKS